MRRTLNHTARIKCKDVASSFAKRRAALVALAQIEGAKVISDDGVAFHAERFDTSNSCVVYLACAQGAPFLNGPAIVRRFGVVEYADLLLPK